MDTRDAEPPADDRFASLIARARRGDQDAIGELMSEYRNYLLLIANAEFDPGLQGKLAPSDLVQQSLLAAQQNLAGFRGETVAEFRSWLRKILKNDLRDAQRKFRGSQRREIGREKNIDDQQQQGSDLPDRFHTPRTDALMREQARVVQLAIAELSPQYQQVLDLRNWQELPFAEIGSQMNCSEDAARKTWYRAVVRLEETIARLFPEIVSIEIPASPDSHD
ncbi:MAG: sigma-70 family RNA polymerase sigma factor [Pirellulaceae bacterium]